MGPRSLTHGFDELVSLPFLREVNPYEHQLWYRRRAGTHTESVARSARILYRGTGVEHFRWRRTLGSRATSMRCLAT